MPEILGIILTALLSACIGAIGGSWALNRSAATKAEVEALKGIIEEYRLERLDDREEIACLNEEIESLRTYMEEKGLTPPPRKIRRKNIGTLP